MSSNTLIPNTPTTIGSWALLIAKAIESYGIDSHRLFEQVGIDLAAIVENPEVRLPVRKMTDLWHLAVQQTNDDAFALRLTKFFQPNTYSAVGLVAASSRNVLDGLERCLRYFTLTTDAAQYQLDKSEHQVVMQIIIPSENLPVASEAIEAFSATLISLFRIMSGDDFSPLSVTFCHQKESNQQAYQEFFNCPVLFGQPSNTMVFNRQAIEQPQMLANPSLAQTLEQWIIEHLERFSQGLISTKVKAHILENIMLGDIGLESIAHTLHMGQRTLQRKLKLEGKNFNELLDECRHHIATKLLGEQKMPLIEISFMLGFSSQSGFTRAFRRWTGVSPKSYRDSHGHKLL